MLAPVFEAVLDPGASRHFDLLLAARDLWPGFGERAGVFVDRSGALATGRRAWLHEVSERMARLGLRAVELSRQAAGALAPGLSDGLEAALLTREDWRLDARAALSAMRRAAEAAGVSFADRRVTGTASDELLVVATGWEQGLQPLAPELAVLTPIKGHLLRVAAPKAWGCVVRGEGIYAAPFDGGWAVGATMEPGVSGLAPDPAKAAPLARAGAALFPAVAAAPHELCAGVRAAAPDGLPLVGRGQAPGVLVAVGARRNGWLLAPLIGRMIAAYANGRDPGAYAAAFDPRRFAAPPG